MAIIMVSKIHVYPQMNIFGDPVHEFLLFHFKWF